MYIQELTIEVKTAVNKNQLVDEFGYLLSCYRKSGQSQSDNKDAFITRSFIKSVIATIEKDSLDNKYNTAWVTQQLKKLKDLCSSRLQVKTLGITHENYSDPCKCKTHGFLILFTHLLNKYGPLDCGTCFKPIPLYRIVPLDQVIRQDILRWEQNYISCDELQMGCIVGEKWATQQMARHNSELSRQGMGICAAMKALTGIPVYYYLFNSGDPGGQDKKRFCPACGGPWLLEQRLHRIYDLKCDNCELISSAATLICE